MDIYEDSYKRICRVCLSFDNDNKNMVSLLEDSSDYSLNCYGKAVMTFADIIIEKDSLPSYMCQKCLNLLKQAIIFKQTCEKSDKILKKLIDNSESSNRDFKEIVTQYVMFTDCFTKDCLEIASQEYVSSSSQENLLKNHEKPTINLVSGSFENELSNLFNQDEFEDYRNDTTSENEENNGNSTNIGQEQDIDNILENIERVYKLDRSLLNCFHKKYMKNIVTRKVKIKKRVQVSFMRREGIMSPRKRNIQCKICNKVLANIATFKGHMQQHNGCRYVCELCGKGFAIYALLQSHQAAVHDFGRFFICKQCGYKAARKFELTEHERFHTGERPYACDKCGLTFRRRYIWKKHALYHMEKTVQCPKCPRKFYRRGEMLAHSNNIHERVYVYACHECDVTYAKSSTVRRHLVEKHGISRERQGKVVRINLGKPSFGRE